MKGPSALHARGVETALPFAQHSLTVHLASLPNLATLRAQQNFWRSTGQADGLTKTCKHKMCWQAGYIEGYASKQAFRNGT
eukprot:1138531-Pelagomonas_calceolata.AAC.1